MYVECVSGDVHECAYMGESKSVMVTISVCECEGDKRKERVSVRIWDMPWRDKE